jgi:hypothetical protein
MQTLTTTNRATPPNWAVRQRALIDLMDRAAVPFVEHSTHEDGQLVFRSEWTSMDGTDNGYESFLSFPLFYLLGGNDYIHQLGQKEWEAITRQYTNFGTVERGFVTGFDWFHHSESYTYHDYLALADPDRYRQQALDFAAMYIGEDPQAPNWDPERKKLRSPLNGSKGPRFETTQVDWEYHRPILAQYLAPFEDMEGLDATDPHVKADWTDDEVFERVLSLINSRMTKNDVPLNLHSTSMVTHAYIYTGDDKYKNWVLDYIQTWMDHRDKNGGIVPDNIGPNGEIGELMNGKWWGGYYGWRWPHGARMIVEPSYVAGSCAALMTGDFSWLDLCRSQLDMLWDLRREEDGIIKVPARHGDQGWFDYRKPDPLYYIHLYYLSQSDEDLARLDEVFPDRAGFNTTSPSWHAGKAGPCPPTAWLAFIEGLHPSYPQQMIEETHTGILQSLDRLYADDSDPETRECYHFHNLNPVVPEGLLQMSMGTPAAMYNGGLLLSHVRYFDPMLKRPGLPRHVAVLAEHVTADSIDLTFVNTDPVSSHRVLIQAGTFAEHEFTGASLDGEDIALDERHVCIELDRSAKAHLHLKLKRFAHRPTYDLPDYDSAAS